jgi:hypothetical protein
VSKIVFSVVASIAILSSSPAPCQSPDGTIATGIDFELEEAVVPIIDRYSDCLNKHRPMVINGSPTLVVATETAIAGCRDVRAQLMAEADARLARNPAWADRNKRAAEVTSNFDNTDASARKLARDTDAYLGRTSR